MKRIISLILFAVMILSFVPVSANEATTPLAPPSDWALGDVKKAAEANITSNDITYNYRKAITRAEFCALTYNFIINNIKPPVPKASINFTDTSSVEVNVLYDMGIIKGKAEGIFAPNDFLTREEAATIIIRLVNTLMPVPVTEMYYAYDDEADISPWAADSVQIISNMGIMKGVGNNSFAPLATYTTEEAIVTLVRLCEVYKLNYFNEDLFTDNLNSKMPSDKNYMFSPMSVKMALALAANGADGETKSEILTALGISDLDEFNEFSKELISKYSQTEYLKLNIANSIWINSDKTDQQFSSDYQHKAGEFYSAEAKTVNDQTAVEEINSWVSDKTNGKIPTIANNSDFWASLINAIYFKAAWQDEFSTHATKKDTFTSADGTEAQIDFMNKTSWMTALVSDEVIIAELPYKNRFDKVSSDGTYLGSDTYADLDVSMYLIMCSDGASPEATLHDAISSKSMGSTYANFSMPKFKIEFETSLNDILLQCGISKAFDPENADFKNMFDSGNMFITDTIHKTYISVDEKGTEAAAVTALMMAGSALPPEPVDVKFNKPFYFVIRDNTNGESLFVGRYAFAE